MAQDHQIRPNSKGTTVDRIERSLRCIDLPRPMTHLRSASGTLVVMEHGVRVQSKPTLQRRSATDQQRGFESWTEVAFPVIVRLLRWN